MSVTRRIAFGAGASWFGRGVTILLGLFFLPVLFRHLPKEELGIWLLLGQSWATLGILDFGFGVTLTRRIALAKGKSGGDPNVPLTDETLRDIADLVTCGRRIYPILAAGVFLFSWIAGFFYLRHLELHQVSHYVVWIAWTILCLSQAVNVWSTVWNCLLDGVGYIGWDAIIASSVNVLTLSGQIVAVFCGGRLISLAAIATAGALIQRFSIRWFARQRRPELFALKGRWNPTVMRGMARLAFRAWLTAVGIILVQNTDGFFIASAQGADKIPAYRAAFLIVLNVHMLAAVFASSSAVFISHLWQAGAINEVQRIVERNLRLGLCIVLCGGAAILTAGASLFNVWLGPHNYVGVGVVALFVATFILEQQTYIISTGCRATEDEAFAETMMAGGLLKLFFAYILISRLGLPGLAVATVIAQSLTAHWYVLYRGLRRLKMSAGRYIHSVLMPCMFVFAVAFGLSYSIVTTTAHGNDWLRVVAACATSGAVLVTACWLLVLDGNHRARVAGWVIPKVWRNE